MIYNITNRLCNVIPSVYDRIGDKECMNTIEMNNIKDEQSYYESVKSEIMNYASWNQLRALELIDDGIESCVLKCFFEDYGYAILKKRKNVSIIEDEYNTLVEYNGRCFCKIFDGDL